MEPLLPAKNGPPGPRGALAEYKIVKALTGPLPHTVTLTRCVCVLCTSLSLRETEVHQKKQGASGEAGKMSACAGQ